MQMYIKNTFTFLLIIFSAFHLQSTLYPSSSLKNENNNVNFQNISELATSSLNNIVNIVDKLNFKVATPKEENNLQEIKQNTNNEIVINNLETIKLRNDSLGTMGRLYLPTINLDVAIYFANLQANENYNAQTIVDNIDSAAYFQLSNKGVIADHNYQGFKKITNLSIGSKSYIKKSDGTVETYVLNNKFLGKNITTDLIDQNGNSVQNMQGSLIIYTCYNSSNDIIITLWDKM